MFLKNTNLMSLDYSQQVATNQTKNQFDTESTGLIACACDKLMSLNLFVLTIILKTGLKDNSFFSYTVGINSSDLANSVPQI